MKNRIDAETFEHLVELAALEMDAEHADYLRGELNSQLDVIRELEAIPLEGEISATTHGVPYPPETRQGPRADAWQPMENPAAILDQAPESEYGFIVVPDIPHQKLD